MAIMDTFARTAGQHERLARLGELADRFMADAHAADGENRISEGFVRALRDIGYPGWPVPRERGGQGMTVYEMVLYQERIAQGDPATALGMGWHVSVLSDVVQRRPWPDEMLDRIFEDTVKRGALINKMASEAVTGSPSRGGKPATYAVRVPGGYRIHGRKTFSTFAPVLDYFIVTAVLRDTGELTEFLIPAGAEGMTIEPTWDMVGMRGTASHDLVLDGVLVPGEARALETTKQVHAPNPFLLHVPACYLGIALAARREALKFAASYQPNSLERPILYTPNVGQLLGEMDLALTAARHFLYAVAAKYDEGTYDPDVYPAEMAAAKSFAVQTAIAVVDKALRITGAHGLAMRHPLQRLYRDVRFGLSNPPMDDVTMRLLAQRAIREAEAMR
ncbi:acyl-CoA dehydrogenase family protein [Thermobacillus sp. ZCTH02-B1]|uniref:acyl-CoA dehydrogenase family protein n=1 Tax=Thermobacillus sp. ZCTH02-B1 TaxID=1858795 RepID=UPI0025DEE612|nr:acyl-CoA dehydrogenase family protein [Thermobacillus sp. ZCTH02-B1]